MNPSGSSGTTEFGHLLDETPEAKRLRRERRLLGESYNSAEAIRDRQVARETVRPPSQCPHCHPENFQA